MKGSLVSVKVEPGLTSRLCSAIFILPLFYLRDENLRALTCVAKNASVKINLKAVIPKCGHGRLWAGGRLRKVSHMRGRLYLHKNKQFHFKFSHRNFSCTFPTLINC